MLEVVINAGSGPPRPNVLRPDRNFPYHVIDLPNGQMPGLRTVAKFRSWHQAMAFAHDVMPSHVEYPDE